MTEPKPQAPAKLAEAVPCTECGKATKAAWGTCSAHRKASAAYLAYDAALCKWLRAQRAKG